MLKFYLSGAIFAFVTSTVTEKSADYFSKVNNINPIWHAVIGNYNLK
jgi:hypothetical protein